MLEATPESDSMQRDETNEGIVHMWQGFMSPNPRMFSVFAGTPIQKVSIGHDHCAFITRGRQLFMFGNNQHGQIGDATYNECVAEPKLVELLKDEVIVDASCGTRHTGAVTATGQVYCWGDSGAGQCGTGQLGRYPVPQLVEMIEGTSVCTHGIPGDEVSVVIRMISCGETHTVAVSDVGEVWTWGTGMQLGLNTADQILKPEKVEYLEGRRVLSVSAGTHHTLALVQKLKKSRQQSTSSIESTQSRSRSGSPVVNNVQQHRYRPSTCIKCKEEIYTYTNADDFCIINNRHKCPLGLDVTKETAKRNDLRSSRTLGKVPSKTDVKLLDDKGRSREGSVSGKETPESESRSESSEDPTWSGRDRQSHSIDMGEVEEEECVFTRNMPRSESAMARLEQTSLRKKSYLHTKQHSKSVKSKSDLKSKSSHSKKKNQIAEHVNKTEASDRMISQQQNGTQNVTDAESIDKKQQQQQNRNVVETVLESSQESTDSTAQSHMTDLTDSTESSDSQGHEGMENQVRGQMEGQMEGQCMDESASLLRPGQKDSTSSSRDSGIHKSRSSFLDETEAKEYLEKKFTSDDDDGTSSTEMCDGDSADLPMSPLVKRVENILQYVPSPPAAVQEYVTSFTKNVVSNLRTSFDRFSFAAAQGGVDLDALSKSSSQDSLGPHTPGGSPQLGEKHEKNDEFVIGSSMTRSTSLQSFLRAPASSGRKSSLPSLLITKGKVCNFEDEVVLETEVWSWGKGRKGQLGHGDTLDRPTPCVVKFFSDKRCVKVIAGSLHSVALTANSQVYAWGHNEEGQLGVSDSSSASPLKMRVLVPTPMWDIAAGKSHTIVIGDGHSFFPDVLYTGLEPGTEGTEEVKRTSQLMRLNALKQTGWVKQIAAGGDLCICLTDKNTTGFIATLHEFAASERLFHSKLDTLANLLVKPLLSPEIFKTIEASISGPVVKAMLDHFLTLMDTVAVQSRELTLAIQGRKELESLTLITKSDENTAIFQRYSKAFSDVLALGAMDFIIRSSSAVIERVKDRFGEFVNEDKVDKNNLSLTFRRVLQFPLHHMREYSKILGKLALRYPAIKPTQVQIVLNKFTGEHYTLNQVAQSWDVLKQAASAEHQTAEATRKFWDSCPPKFAEALRVPGRRMLRDSKTNTLSIPSSGRFSMHWLILFNDVFVHGQYSMHQTFPLPTIWVESVQDTDQMKNALTLTMPEEVITVTAPTSSEKAEWLWATNSAIDKVLSDQKHMTRPAVLTGRLTPPLARHATHIFYKNPLMKDAKYTGMWLAGKMNGQGELIWPDGRKYVGRFKQGQQHGHGVFTMKKDGTEEVYDGQWNDGKMNGLGTIRYSNGDVYEGYFKDGKKHGHGVLKQGKMTSGASVYIGEWIMDRKTGYGVLDEISKGQKYMGMWQDDCRHGNGIIVTIDGMYFEGTFTQNKMTGFGLLMTDDNTYYEGEFSGGPHLHGKGRMTLPNGDYIEGHFSGTFTEGIKVNGTFYKSMEPILDRKGFSHALGLVPKTFGTLSVIADRKWVDMFQHCQGLLGCHDNVMVHSDKAWEAVAVMVTANKKAIKDAKRLTGVLSLLEDLEKIPPHSQGKLSLEDYQNIKQYLIKAFETAFHPLGKLMEGLVNVYRATYMGVGAHPRLLHHAMQEVKSYVRRMYPIVRLLFPDLPLLPEPVQVFSESELEEDESEIVTPGELLHPVMLPKIYPPLFTLYALYNEKEDEMYWKRVNHWNKQGDVALMSSLGMDQKFWLLGEEILQDTKQKIASIKDHCYKEAVEMLQHISTSFSPAEKLLLIQKTFNEINKAVQNAVGSEYLWSMDDLFPVFLFVTVRARIRHLGAEIHFIDDLMEGHLQHGELGIMFTTLKACYYQIQNEKIS